jgi:type IV fimbrial biogenesis protein FimT
VVFSLTNSTQPQTSLTASANGSYWAIDAIPAMTDGTETLTFIQSGVLTSQGSNVQITGPAEICFNSVGRIVANSSTGVSGGSCALPTTTLPSGGLAYTYQITLTGADHPLNVEVAMGGQLHLCDPSQNLSSTNTYGC